MKIILLLPLIATAVATLDEEDDGTPKCVKVDECSCRLKNTGTNDGLIDLHPQIVDGQHEPRFTDYHSTNKYYYNPCTTFNYPPSDYVGPLLYTNCNATGTVVCQKRGTQDNYFINLGMIYTANFNYHNGSVFVNYAGLGLVHFAAVELVCDENEIEGKFEVTYESLALVSFRLTSRCACPGKCQRSDLECIGINSCRCARLDGSYAIDISALDNPYEPMQDRVTPTQTILYNPCSPIYGCGEGFAVCMKDGDKVVGLGLANSSKFVTDKDGQISLQYSNGDIRSVVQLKCDEGARDEPFFKVEKVSRNKYVMSVYSACACNGDCNAPTGDCVKSDTCSCQLKENGKQFSLHPLDNPNKPLRVKDREGYIYYYNPCSGLGKSNRLPPQCQHAGACQEDPNTATGDSMYYAIGGMDPSIRYSDGNVTLHYSRGDDGCTFDVRLICGHMDTTVFAVDGDTSRGMIHYNFTLTTKHGCLY